MTGRYGDVDYPTLTKRSVLFGLALFAIGAVGELLVHGLGVQLPRWEETLLFDAEVLGVLIVFVAPFLFGIVLPLTE
jgi:hydrogenase/urease accessory protein HupE